MRILCILFFTILSVILFAMDLFELHKIHKLLKEDADLTDEPIKKLEWYEENRAKNLKLKKESIRNSYLKSADVAKIKRQNLLWVLFKKA